jgi:hypothetical protein
MSIKKTGAEINTLLDPGMVRFMIEKSRAISAGISDEYEDGHEREVHFNDYDKDIHQHAALAEEEDVNSNNQELQHLIDDLNVDEAAELVALVWVGRGDFDPGEWKKAVEMARASATNKTSAYLMGMPMLGDLLQEGLAAIGA